MANGKLKIGCATRHLLCGFHPSDGWGKYVRYAVLETGEGIGTSFRARVDVSFGIDLPFSQESTMSDIQIVDWTKDSYVASLISLIVVQSQVDCADKAWSLTIDENGKILSLTQLLYIN